MGLRNGSPLVLGARHPSPMSIGDPIDASPRSIAWLGSEDLHDVDEENLLFLGLDDSGAARFAVDLKTPPLAGPESALFEDARAAAGYLPADEARLLRRRGRSSPGVIGISSAPIAEPELRLSRPGGNASVRIAAQSIFHGSTPSRSCWP